jgi:predicted transcriptional regulator
LRKSIASSGRRSGIEIIAEILEEAKQGITKTRLVYKTNLNFFVVRKHLDFLLAKDLLKIIHEPNQLYVTTPKGSQFLEEFSKMKEILGSDEVEQYNVHSYM